MNPVVALKRPDNVIPNVRIYKGQKIRKLRTCLNFVNQMHYYNFKQIHTFGGVYSRQHNVHNVVMPADDMNMTKDKHNIGTY